MIDTRWEKTPPKESSVTFKQAKLIQRYQSLRDTGSEHTRYCVSGEIVPKTTALY